MAFTWTYDAPTGVYKNNVLSSDLRKAAIAQTKFMQLVRPIPGYGKKKGETVTLTRVRNIAVPANGRIRELQRIPEDTIELTTVSVTVAEWGRAVPYTNLAEDLGKFDPENIIQDQLKKQMALTMDATAATTLKTAPVKAIPTGATSLVFDTDGTASTTATSNLLVYHVEQIRDYMFSTLFVPPFEGDDYVALVSTKAKRGLMNDTNWEKWHQYTDPQAKYKGEVGRLENVRFIEINNANALSNALGSGGVLGEAIFVGDDAIVMAVAQDPELRAKTPDDYGRDQGVAWYGILEFMLPWQSANPGESRIVHVTSA